MTGAPIAWAEVAGAVAVAAGVVAVVDMMANRAISRTMIMLSHKRRSAIASAAAAAAGVEAAVVAVADVAGTMRVKSLAMMVVAVRGKRPGVRLPAGAVLRVKIAAVKIKVAKRAIGKTALSKIAAVKIAAVKTALVATTRAAAGGEPAVVGAVVDGIIRKIIP